MIQNYYESPIWVKQFDNSNEFNQDVLNTTKAISATTPKPVADHNVDLWVSIICKLLDHILWKALKTYVLHIMKKQTLI
jgi:hypothetical protein